MMLKILLNTSVLMLLLITMSCSKESVSFIPTDTTITITGTDTLWETNLTSKTNTSIDVFPLTGIENIKEQLSRPILQDSFIAEQGKIIEFPNNVTATIPASVCIDSSNQLCKGKVSIELIILRKKGDFIVYNHPSLLDNQNIELEGDIFIRLSQNGKNVNLVNGANITVQYSLAKAIPGGLGMQGVTDGRFVFSWVLRSSDVIVTTWTDLQNNNGGITITTSKLGWLSVVNGVMVQGTTSNYNKILAVKLPNVFTNTNTLVYAVFKDKNSVVPLVGDTNSKTFKSVYNGLFGGQNVAIVAISSINNQIYFAKQDITVSSPNTVQKQLISLDPVRTDINKVNVELDNL